VFESQFNQTNTSLTPGRTAGQIVVGWTSAVVQQLEMADRRDEWRYVE